jgi:hypothetical protein
VPNYIIKILIIAVISMSVPSLVFAGSGVQLPAGSRGQGMGNASVALHDIWAIQNNMAGLAYFEHPAVAFSYQDFFLVNELGIKSGAFVMPTRSGAFGLNFNYFGYSQYSESKIGLAYAKSFGHGFSAGLQLDYLGYRLAGEYGNKNVFTFELGIQKEISEKLVIGAHAFNPIGVKLNDEPNDRVPSVYRLGIAWSVSDDLIIVLETEKDLDYKPLIRAGIEYRIANVAFARVGWSSVPTLTGSDKLSVSSMYTFGFGLMLGKFDLDFAASVHQTLGWSPCVSLAYRFGKIN